MQEIGGCVVVSTAAGYLAFCLHCEQQCEGMPEWVAARIAQHAREHEEARWHNPSVGAHSVSAARKKNPAKKPARPAPQ